MCTPCIFCVSVNKIVLPVAWVWNIWMNTPFGASWCSTHLMNWWATLMAPPGKWTFVSFCQGYIAFTEILQKKVHTFWVYKIIYTHGQKYGIYQNNYTCVVRYFEYSDIIINVFYTYLATILNMSGNIGAAKAGSLCIKVPSMIMQRPISSSLYSSINVPHSEHLKIKYYYICINNALIQ